jgi:sugar phosphate isomerase/epimerase
MNFSNLSRRSFIKRVAAATAIGAGIQLSNFPVAANRGPAWPIGCFNRPWSANKLDYDTTLKGIKAAGYNLTGLLSRTREDDPFIGSDASPEYLRSLRDKLQQSGIKANMGAMRSRHNVPLQDSIRDVRKQIDHAVFLSVPTVLSFGVDKPEEFDHYYKVMADAAAYAQDRGIKLVLKPHGGGSGAAEEILRCIEEVNHSNFKIWYDAGNIIYYTGKDPVAELRPIAKHVTGFCAKDCAEPRGNVMIQFGEGKVDFHGVFRTLKEAGFDGPIMVESCAGKTPEELVRFARENREFLERVLASI